MCFCCIDIDNSFSRAVRSRLSNRRKNLLILCLNICEKNERERDEEREKRIDRAVAVSRATKKETEMRENGTPQASEQEISANKKSVDEKSGARLRRTTYVRECEKENGKRIYGPGRY